MMQNTFPEFVGGPRPKGDLSKRARKLLLTSAEEDANRPSAFILENRIEEATHLLLSRQNGGPELSPRLKARLDNLSNSEREVARRNALFIPGRSPNEVDSTLEKINSRFAFSARKKRAAVKDR